VDPFSAPIDRIVDVSTKIAPISAVATAICALDRRRYAPRSTLPARR
jgi:hypothetical protein